MTWSRYLQSSMGIAQFNKSQTKCTLLTNSLTNTMESLSKFNLGMFKVLSYHELKAFPFLIIFWRLVLICLVVVVFSWVIAFWHQLDVNRILFEYSEIMIPLKLITFDMFGNVSHLSENQRLPKREIAFIISLFRINCDSYLFHWYTWTSWKRVRKPRKVRDGLLRVSRSLIIEP